MMTLSSHKELFIFKGHSKQELIKFHSRSVKKISKYYYLHFMTGGMGLRNGAKSPAHRSQKEIGTMASMGFAECAWSDLAPSFFLCHPDITVSWTLLGICSLPALAGSGVYLLIIWEAEAYMQQLRGEAQNETGVS